MFKRFWEKIPLKDIRVYDHEQNGCKIKEKIHIEKNITPNTDLRCSPQYVTAEPSWEYSKPVFTCPSNIPDHSCIEQQQKEYDSYISEYGYPHPSNHDQLVDTIRNDWINYTKRYEI